MKLKEYLKRMLFSFLVLSLCVNVTSFNIYADDSLNENKQEVQTQVETQNGENNDDLTSIDDKDQLREDISEKANVVVDTTTDKYEPTVEVSIDDQILELNRDYTVQYETDLDNQVGQVTVTGINSYTGSVVQKFDIVDETVTVSNDDVDTNTQDENDVGIAAFSIEQNDQLQDGIYIIRSSLNSNYVLDVTGGSYSNSANVQLYGYNGSDAQLWRVSHDGEGYITFTNVKSGKVLDLNGGSVTNGRNIQQYDSNGTKAQKWVLKGDSNGYEIVSAANSNYVLDLNGAIVRNSQNIQLYQSNGTKAQKWVFSAYVSPVERAKQLASENVNTIQNGTYVISTSKNSGYVFDVNGGSYSNSANVQLYGYNGTNAQLWTISHDSEGFVTFTNVKSGKVLDLNGATISNGSNIQQYESNGTRAQKWIVTGNSNGYEIRSALNPDYVIDLSDAVVQNSQNIQLYQSNGTQAQKWTFRDYSEMYVFNKGSYGDLLKAVDISEYQANLNLADIKNQIDFAILRVGYTGYVSGTMNRDRKFNEFYNQAMNNQIPVGVYYYSCATNVSKAIEEANFVINQLKGKSIKYPVYIDFEDPTNQAGLDGSTKEAICNAFCLTIKNAGYKAGVYSRQNFLFDYTTVEFDHRWNLWVSNYGYNSGQPSSNPYTNKPYFNMWQYTSKGSLSGYNGNLDLNIWYVK